MRELGRMGQKPAYIEAMTRKSAGAVRKDREKGGVRGKPVYITG